MKSSVKPVKKVPFDFENLKFSDSTPIFKITQALIYGLRFRCKVEREICEKILKKEKKNFDELIITKVFFEPNNISFRIQDLTSIYFDLYNSSIMKSERDDLNDIDCVWQLNCQEEIIELSARIRTSSLIGKKSTLDNTLKILDQYSKGNVKDINVDVAITIEDENGNEQELSLNLSDFYKIKSNDKNQAQKDELLITKLLKAHTRDGVLDFELLQGINKYYKDNPVQQHFL